MSYNKNHPNVGLMGHTKVSKLRCSLTFIRSSSYFWRGSGQNSDIDVKTFRNCDMTRFEIQTGGMHPPPPQQGLVSKHLL